jgi:hypothetical protein
MANASLIIWQFAPKEPVFAADLLADPGIVQKDEMRFVREARPRVLRKRDVDLALLPDCAEPDPRAKLAGSSNTCEEDI